MKRKTNLRRLTFLLVCAGCVPTWASTIDFDSIAIGTPTVFGANFGNTPGDLVLMQDGITMTVEELILGSTSGFDKAEIGGLYAADFATNPLSLDNISVMFDFTGLGSNISLVTLEVQEFGVDGGSNLSVNGQPLVDLSNLPMNIAPGVIATFANNLLTLSGSINSLQIGGQELGIDTVTAVPEPSSVVLLGMAAAAAIRRRRKCLTSPSR